MIDAKEAIRLIESKDPKNKVIGLSETDDKYVLVLDNDNEGYETVDKTTGQTGFIWVWDYIELSKAGKTRNLELDRVS